MNLEKIKFLIDEVKKFDPHRLGTGGPASEDAIQTVERSLGVKFCDDYRQFLKEIGLLDDGYDCITGIWRSDAQRYAGSTVLYHTKEFNEEYFNLGNATVLDPGGDELYIILDHEDGTIYYYDIYSKKYEKKGRTFFEYVLEFVGRHYEDVKEEYEDTKGRI